VLLFAGGTVFGGESLIVRTNYYALTGAAVEEIHADLARKRPWKQEVDGFTGWKIDWSYRTEAADSECRLQSFEVKTEITITVPRWIPPAEADEGTKRSWATYINGLLAHEEGHKRIALAASNEVRRRLQQLTSATTCDALAARIKRDATEAVEEFKRREKAYDERTDHGRKDGTGFPAVSKSR
jgi:predicted secreted Zn-dependent protease